VHNPSKRCIKTVGRVFGVSECLRCHETGVLRRLVRPVKRCVSQCIPSATPSVSAGTGRAAMTRSAAANASRRLRILTDEEIEALYGRPCFSADDRAASFTLTPVEHDLPRSFRGVSSQLAFLLRTQPPWIICSTPRRASIPSRGSSTSPKISACVRCGRRSTGRRSCGLWRTSPIASCRTVDAGRG